MEYFNDNTDWRFDESSRGMSWRAFPTVARKLKP